METETSFLNLTLFWGYFLMLVVENNWNSLFKNILEIGHRFPKFEKAN